MGFGFAFIALGGQGLFLVGSILVLVGGTLERSQQGKSKRGVQEESGPAS